MKLKKYEPLIYSAIGLLALLLILVAVNFLVSRVPARVDLTDGDLYTLSPGTKKILRGLQSPVKIKLYVSQGEGVPVPLRGCAQRVEDTLREFKQAAGSNLIVERYNPKPDSEEEDSPQRERLLEYDLIRAIARVGNPERPKIGLMAGLPVLGEKFNPFTRQSSEPWVLATELKRAFDVKEVPIGAKEIDKDINVLLLIHPRDAQPQTEYALDQFVLRGGKLIAFVDPYAYFDQNPTMPGVPPEPSSSTLPTLFKAWGLTMDPGKVVSDVVFGSGGGQRYTPTVLSLNRTAFSRDDIVTGQIETLLYAFGGAFEVKPQEGIKVTELVRSSPNSMLVDNMDATKSGDDATKAFKPSGKAMPLAVRLTGKFKTAFPDGLKDAEKPQGEKQEASKPVPNTPALRESANENSLILVADVDLLADGAAVDVQDVFGRKVVVPSNGNLAFAMGMVEQFAAGDEFISLRSRTGAFRPLTVVRELEAEAQKQYFGKIQALEEEVQKTTAKLQELQKSQGPAGKPGQLLSPEQQTELERFRKTVAEARLQLKEVRKNLRQDAESLVFWTKVANIVLMPLLVALIGLLVAVIGGRRRKAV